VVAETGRWLRNFKTKKEYQLIILLDIKMPQMDGFEFMRNKKLDKELTSQIIIFMLSSTLDPLDKRAKKQLCQKTLLCKC
jgi:CheY-like chemotaxis protein